MAAGSTYTPIATQTLASATTTVTFSSIPQTYTDLILVFSGASTGTQGYRVGLGNGSIDTGTDYSETFLSGSGSAASSGRRTGYPAIVDPTVYTDQQTIIHQFMNYSNTSTYKTVLYRSNSAGNEVTSGVALWRAPSNAAINIITATAYTQNFVVGSTFTLYGIAAA